MFSHSQVAGAPKWSFLVIAQRLGLGTMEQLQKIQLQAPVFDARGNYKCHGGGVSLL
ncbi:hypothetical protein J1N35_045870 [Gossypium stocksii]|uniref:Uncharacterized protein n=1 Tax=Gossypium stocksii TaxID=47602 RepID=A0A9D3ZHE8_9ROSI|nr:hypothetical protein J1N35_045870 [Gossypium stocksii]